MTLDQFPGYIRRCVDDYAMLQPGDHVAVGISGGKDSMALLAGLSHLRRFHPSQFTLSAITIDMGFPGMDFDPVREYCEKIEVPYTIVHTDIREIVFDVRQEDNPCSLCSKMRRGALNSAIREMGCRRLALGHHFDDAIETFLMSLLFEGRLHCFRPMTYMSRMEVTQIRPMLYLGEAAAESLIQTLGLPVVPTTCPVDKSSKRAEIKSLLAQLSREYPDLKSKVFGAMQRLPLEGWAPVKPGNAGHGQDLVI